MANTSLELPQETSWKFLGASSDMMDTNFCNKQFPFRWQSSIAISAFEPKQESIPPDLCEGQITFLKVTTTITGYQPTRQETEEGYVTFPNIPTEELNRIIDQYFACYGAQLNISVFPNSGQIPGEPEPQFALDKYPHIIDVEPKIRDLIQASSETGEILTSSKSNVKTNKNLTHTESTQTGYELGAMVGKKDEWNVTGKLSHSNTETDQENWNIETNASSERQEKQGSTTQISQLYNLLSSYHIGTNRALFLMLSRPHVLQPTDHRSFIQGLRQIEGTQEFILVVARPKEIKGLSIEAFLETAHFPEGLIPQEPQDEYEEGVEEFTVSVTADNGLFSGECKRIENDERATYTIDTSNGWVIDRRPERGSDPTHSGMKEIANNDNRSGDPSGYDYRPISDNTAKVFGKICGSAGWGPKTIFNRTYQVFTRSPNPKPNPAGASVDLEKLLITGRGLCISFLSTDNCPKVEPDRVLSFPDNDVSTMLYERKISVNPALLTHSAVRETRLPAVKELLHKIQNALATSWRLPRRRAFEEAPGFLDSDYFKDQIKNLLSDNQLRQPVSKIKDIPTKVHESLGKEFTCSEALDLTLDEFVIKTGLKISEAVKIRRMILGAIS